MADESPVDSFMRAFQGPRNQQMGFAALLMTLGLLGWYAYRDRQETQP